MSFAPIIAVVKRWCSVQKLVESCSFSCAGNSGHEFVVSLTTKDRTTGSQPLLQESPVTNNYLIQLFALKNPPFRTQCNGWCIVNQGNEASFDRTTVKTALCDSLRF